VNSGVISFSKWDLPGEDHRSSIRATFEKDRRQSESSTWRKRRLSCFMAAWRTTGRITTVSRLARWTRLVRCPSYNGWLIPHLLLSLLIKKSGSHVVRRGSLGEPVYKQKQYKTKPGPSSTSTQNRPKQYLKTQSSINLKFRASCVRFWTVTELWPLFHSSIRPRVNRVCSQNSS
jgi:hypothetical protein